MTVIYDKTKIDSIIGVVTVGFFDGIHCGHQKLIMELVQRSKDLQVASVVITFWPAPKTILFPGKKNELLTTLEEKYHHFENLGVDYVFVIPFNEEVASQTAFEFVQDLTNERLTIAHLLLGYDHRFGSDCPHELKIYENIGKLLQFTVSKCEVYNDNKSNKPISSSIIREYLKEGELSLANKSLGYNYRLTGEVVFGKQLGQRMGFPTANIKPKPYKLIPQVGVYAVFVLIGKLRYKGMLNIGFRPSYRAFEMPTISIEANVFDFSGNLYGKQLEIIFISRIRDEKKFSNLEQLKEQLNQDKLRAIQVLSI